MIFLSSTRLLALQPRSTVNAAARISRATQHGNLVRQISHAKSSSSPPTKAVSSLLVTGAAATATYLYVTGNNIADLAPTTVVQCSAGVPLGGEPVMLSPSKEPATGILFPRLCNGMTLVGCGVRVKWGFVKVSCCNVIRYYHSILGEKFRVLKMDHCFVGAGVCSRYLCRSIGNVND